MKKYKMIAVGMSALLAAYCLPIDSSNGVKDFFTAVNVEAVSDDSGSCGENCTYTFDSATGTLTISGSGDMYNYDNDSNKAPWYDYCLHIKSVIIENGVTSIGEWSFYNCSNLTEITIPDSVTSIGSNAFEHCSSLTEITIPDSVTSIGGGAFYDCSSLTEITIPDSVASIGNCAFNACSSLTNIIVDDNNKNYISIDGILFNKDKSLLMKYPEGKKDTYYIIPNSVDSIGNWSFYNCSLTEITIPDSVTSIESSAFYNCSGLTSITIPDSVTSIGSGAFECCANLKSITIPDSVTSIEYYTFRNCSSLTSITIPDSVTSIGSSAFANCSSLTEITIPDSVTSIGQSAFSNCSSLTNIIVADNNKNYISIDGILFNKDKSLLMKYPEGKKDTYYIIPNNVTSIGSFAFYDCSSLTEITIPDSVTSIGSYAFSSCSGLTSITIPDGVTSIENYAFYGCKNLTDVYYSGTETEWESITIISGNECLTNATIHYNEKPEKTTADASFSVEKKTVPLDSADDEIELEFKLDSKDIKIANGKFDFTYDTNYMTLTSISAGSGVLSEDFGHNNTTASFSINSDKGAGGQLVVMTFKIKDAQEGDKYSVKVTNSGDISGIDSSGNPVTINPVYSNGYIEITAPSSSSGKAFEWKKNNWSFTNSTEYFDNKKTWYITDSDLDKLLSRCNNNEKTSIKKKLKKNSRWDGSCVGLSILSVLNAQNVFKTNNYFENTSYLYDVPAPQRDDIESLITYYHLAQKLDSFCQKKNETAYLTESEKLTEIISMLTEFDEPLVLLYSQKSFGGHAVVAYGVEEGSWIKNNTRYSGRILIYDNINNQFDDDYCLYYNSDLTKWTIPAYPSVNTSKKAEIRLYSNKSEIINSISYFDDKSANTSLTNNYIADLNTNVHDSDFSLSKVSVSNGDFSAGGTLKDDEIRMDYDYSADGSVSEYYDILLKDSKSGYMYKIDSEPTDVDLSMNYENDLLFADVKNAEYVAFTPDGYIEAGASEGDFKLEAVSNEGSYTLPWYDLSVCGYGSNYISLEKVNNGYIISGDNLTNVKVLANNDEIYAGTVFTTDYDSVLAYAIDDYTIGIKADSNNDGIYDKILNSDSFKTGDANCDGLIDIRDVAMLQQYIVKIADLDDTEMYMSDIIADNKVDVKDLSQLKKYLIKVIDKF
ncbi:MAG: leucine-rich repeat protein [Oscillospiraceae bacterium]